MSRLICASGLLALLASLAAAQRPPLSASRPSTRRVCQFAYLHDFPLDEALPLQEKIGIAYHPHLNLTGPPSGDPKDFDVDKHIVGTKLAHSYPTLKPDRDYCLVCYAMAHQAQNLTLRVGCHNGSVPDVRFNEGYPSFAALPNEYDIGGWESYRELAGPRIHIFQSLFRSTRSVAGQALTGHTYDLDACLEGDEDGRCKKRDSGKGCQLFSYLIAANSPGTVSHQCWMLPLLQSELNDNAPKN